MGLPEPSPSLQEPFKRLASTGGLMGSKGACFCHLETEPSPSQPQMESGGISPVMTQGGPPEGTRGVENKPE